MINFKDMPEIRKQDKNHFALTKNFIFTYDNGDFVKYVTIPKGYVTNGADIPRFFWRLFPPFSPEYLPAVIVHDYFCDEAEKNHNNKQLAKNLYKFADTLFKESLLALGVSRWKTTLFYNAVRLHHKLKNI